MSIFPPPPFPPKTHLCIQVSADERLISSRPKAKPAQIPQESRIEMPPRKSQLKPGFVAWYCWENGVVLLGWWAPSCLTPPRSPFKGDIPNEYPL